MAIPILGRLDLDDYFQLAFAIAILMGEWWLRLMWPMIEFMITLIGWNPTVDGGDPFTRLQNTLEIAEFFSFKVEEHAMFTADGYFLIMHRIMARSSDSIKPPVLMLHGTMLSSDIWLVHRHEQKNLPFHLAMAGHDVWLGNRRGNKYCGKHMHLKVYQREFWDWSIDEVAIYDIPRMADYICERTGLKSIITLGFSQGSAELLASLSLNAELNRKVSLCICLGAMTRPKPAFIRPSLIQTLVHSTPQLLYLFFGRKMMLSSVLFWMDALPSHRYAQLIDFFLSLLFGWDCARIDINDRIHMYQKLYSYCSVKTISHWFQMLRVGRFQMFDDQSLAMGVWGRNSRHHIPAPLYPVGQITCPVALFHGERDNLSDPEYTRSLFVANKHAVVADVTVEGFEHLDFLMAHDVDTCLFPLVDKLLSRIKIRRPSPSSAASTLSRHPSDLSIEPNSPKAKNI